MDDHLLFGHDPTPRLVAVQHLVPSADDAPAQVRVYQRMATGVTETTDVPFYPFFFLTDLRLLHGFPRQAFRGKTLDGDNAYRYLIVCNAWQTMRDAVRHIARRVGARDHDPEQVYLIANPVQQYLTQSGRTLCKDMDFDDLRRLQLDIEVVSTGGFPQAEQAEDRIILIALSDNHGWRHLLDARQASELEMLAQVIHLIRQRDPDVIEGHNIYAFDLAYLMARCARYGIDFAIGRDGSVPRVFPSSMRFAERTVAFPALDIAGRHVIDTYLQVLAFDVFKRDLPDYTLKTAARYFGLAASERTYIAGHDISRVWHTDPDHLCAYALDDVQETERLARHLSGSTFYLTQMLPMAYGQVARTGPAAKIEALFVREYLRQRHALPGRSPGSSMAGGYTDVFVTGVVGPIVYADVESLYPSIMLTHDIRPRTDTLRLFPTLLQRLTRMRLDTKHRMQTAAAPAERSALDAQQSSYKILINSFYGQLGFQRALFSDFAAADRVATTGQALLRQLIAAIRQAGGTVVEVDTDGVLFIPPTTVQGAEAEGAFVHGLQSALPEGIRLSYEGRYHKMLSYKMKNYALLRYDGTLHAKGSALVSRATEPFGKQFMRDVMRLLLYEDLQGLHDLYLATVARMTQHAWRVEDFARTETLKVAAATYQAEVTTGQRHKAASYELALARAQATGQPVRPGDRITYYITGTSPTVTSFTHARFAADWRPEAPDENTAYYLRRLDECAQRFAPFFRPEDFGCVFGTEGLFGFSPLGMRLHVTEHGAA